MKIYDRSEGLTYYEVQKKTAALLCGVLLIAGCGNAKIQENSMVTAGEVEEPVQTEETPQEDGAVVIEAGPDKKIYEAGSVTYTLYDFRLYESPEEAGIDPDEMLTIDAKYYMDRSIFLIVQADLRNIDYTGNDKEGEINVSRFTIAPNQQDETLQWKGLLGDAAGRYFLVKEIGDTRLSVLGTAYDGSSAVVEFTLEREGGVEGVIYGQLYNESKGAWFSGDAPFRICFAESGENILVDLNKSTREILYCYAYLVTGLPQQRDRGLTLEIYQKPNDTINETVYTYSGQH